jgi:hypothetical protein
MPKLYLGYKFSSSTQGQLIYHIKETEEDHFLYTNIKGIEPLEV